MVLRVGREEPEKGIPEQGMRINSVVGAAVAGLIIAAASIAMAGNSTSTKHEDFAAAGTHQFYVWCSGAPDFMATEYGSSAADAQMRLYEESKKAGMTTCWPVWQGRLSG
jgi:hypothetical protein